tara:strand:- start:1366 stop:1521 length:156 start_codon:yes stop_codon:yes gene_type:complete
MIAGYNESIKKAKEIGPEEINKYGTIIKFYCKETQVIVPKRKPKLKTSLDI